MALVIDQAKIGKKGYPRHWAELGLNPPMKEVAGAPGAPPVSTPPTREQMERMVDAERDRRVDAGFAFAGTKFQSRRDDRENIAGAGTLAAIALMSGAQAGDLRWHGGESDFVWIAENNSLVPMDAQTVVAFGRAAADWKSAHIFAARALKDAETIPADFRDDAYWPTVA